MEGGGGQIAMKALSSVREVAVWRWGV